ncbi:hypothetical protein KIW84_063429 [Lathyrus oleraceus]|uniref:TLDc domain-containing protein n=1 Tax=Pisum sativum TaxID=3888 RepID=A0A9D4W9T2_PEA|nr:hypothetical protein KIW84_063429 [Pisum sativum]
MGTHTCARVLNNRSAKSKWVAKDVVNKMQICEKVRIADIMIDMRKNYSVGITPGGLNVLKVNQLDYVIYASGCQFTSVCGIQWGLFVQSTEVRDFFSPGYEDRGKKIPDDTLSTLKHGISLRTMIRNTAQLNTPALLVAGDMQGAVFGALLDCPLIPTTKPKYQGTHQTFVFTNIYGHPRIFRPTGVNRYYYLCSNDSLALGGGGGFALRLDGDLLTGTSGPCETFGNRCLAHSPEFELKNVELWGFTHA